MKKKVFGEGLFWKPINEKTKFRFSPQKNKFISYAPQPASISFRIMRKLLLQSLGRRYINLSRQRFLVAKNPPAADKNLKSPGGFDIL